MLFRPRRLTGEEKKQITEKHGLADACFCCGGKDGKWLCAERTHGVFHGSAARFRIAPCGEDAILTAGNGKRPMADAWRCRKIILYCDKQVRRAGADRFQATRTVLSRRISAAGQQAESGEVRRLFKPENKIDARRRAGREVCAPCRISGAFIRRVRSAAARAEPENRKMPWTVFEGPSTAFHIL